LEAQLVSHAKELDSYWMPLARKKCLKLAYDLAKGTHISHKFNIETTVLENILLSVNW
jgi:hypothetical protein